MSLPILPPPAIATSLAVIAPQPLSPQGDSQAAIESALKVAQAIIPNGAGTTLDSQGNQLNIGGGTQVGNNLFHSFDRFGLTAGQTANFIATPTIENILGRINGGEASLIDGQLQITGADANLFLLNPAGIIFGPNAQLNLPAAFTASTSDRLSFGDPLSGPFFNVFGDNDYSQLLGNPDGFVFSSSAPAGILNQGNLSLTPGQQLNLMGGSVTSSGRLAAPDGQVNVVAAPGNSRVRLGQGGATLTIAANAVAAPDNLPPNFSPETIPELSAGNVTLQQLEAQGAIVSASGQVILQGSDLQTGGNLAVVAGDRLTIRDSNTNPFIAKAGGNLTLQGSNSLDILALSNPQTLIQSGGSLSLISDNAISADAHFTSGGDFSLTTSQGDRNAFISLYDPIIRAAGNVSFGDYSGTALKVEAGGSIATGNITITGPDTATIPATDPDFAELTTLPSLILRAGQSLTSPASLLPLASGGTTFNGSSPADPTASITAGNIDTTTTLFSNLPPTNAGNITLSAPGSITAGNLNASVINNIATGDPLRGGQVTLSSGNGILLGDINTSVTSRSSIDVQAGEIQITALGGIQLGAINTAVDAIGAFQNAQAGNVAIASGGDLQFTSIDSTAIGAAFTVPSGNGGAVSLTATGTLQGTGLIPASTSTIDSTGLNNSGPLELTHDGGPDNIPFQTGNAAVNGTAGDLTAGTVTSSNQTFGNLGLDSLGPNGEISITFTNTAPSLSGGTPIATPVDQPIDIAIADLNLTTTDPNIDNIRLELDSIDSGTLSRNGISLVPGDSISPTDILTYNPARGAIGNQPAFSLRASDGVSVSQRVQIPVNIRQSQPRIPQQGSDYLLRDRPLQDIPRAIIQTETQLLGMPLMPAPAIVELSAIRGILPEAPLLMLPLPTWNISEVSSFTEIANANARGTLEILGSGVAALPPGAGQNLTPISGSADGFNPNASGLIDLNGNLISPNGNLSGSLSDGLSGNDFGITVVEGNGTQTGNFAITNAGINSIGDILPPGLQTDPFNPFFPGGFTGPPGTTYSISSPIPSGGVDSPPIAVPPTLGSLPTNPDVSPEVSGISSGPDGFGPDGSSPNSPIASGIPGESPSSPGNNNPGSNTVADANTTAVVLDCPQQVAQISQAKANERKEPVYKALIKCFQQNLAQAEQSQNGNLKLYALNNLGSSYFVVGDYLQAIAAHEQQLAAAQITGDRTHIGIALAGIGAAQAALGDYDSAIAQYHRSLSQLPPDKALQWRGLTLRNLGNAYLSKKDYTKALDYQNQSLALSRGIKDSYGEMQSLGNLGNAYSLNAEFDPALQAYNQSLTLAQQLGAELEEAQTLLGLATTYSYQKRYESAIAYAQQSLLLLQQLENRLGQGIALTNLGDAQYQIGQLPPAEASFRQGVQVWESLRAGLGNNDAYKVSIFETQRAAYRNLQEVLADQNRVGESLEVAEQSRGRAFVELLARGNAQAQSQVNAAAIAPPKLAELQRIAREQNATLVEYGLAQAQFVDTPHGSSVQYASEPQDSKILIWVVQPSGQVQLRQVDLLAQTDKPSLQRLVEVARLCLNDAFCLRRADRQTRFGFVAPSDPASGNLTNAPTGPEPQTQAIAANNPLHQLHQLLIDPIADLLPRSAGDRVIFIPQDQLFLVPFPALQASDGSYLIDRHTILTAPAIQLLAATKARRQQLGSTNHNALVVGNPSPMPKGFSPLPFTANEASTVAQLLGSQAITGAQATEAQIKQQLTQASIIHLATHGIFNATKPLEGAIALAPSGSEDGLLSAAEILNSRLQAKLVVLSACDTGQGRITGDGVIGLSRAFLAAGASSVMVSLWQVPDDATATLMTEFHRQRQQNPDNAQALRQAMLTVKQAYNDPKAWSGFTLIGESE